MPAAGHEVQLIPRALTSRLASSLAAMRGVLLVGPRQCGKSTLARSLVHGRYVTLDDENDLRAATSDPSGLLEAVGVPATIDEVQRAPQLLLALKAAIDRGNRRGMYLLTGSADVLALPTTADTLVGRVAVHQLHPLMQCEIERTDPTMYENLFGGQRPHAPGDAPAFSDLAMRALRGGFPDVVLAGDDQTRREWLSSYVATIIERELPAVAGIEHRAALPRMLRLMAARSPGQLNVSALATDSGVPRTTLDRYLSLLSLIFLIRLSTPWYSSAASREVKQPRLFFADTGVFSHLRRARFEQLVDTDRTLLGALVENLVGTELSALASLDDDVLGVHHWRTSRGHEVDFVVEHASLDIAGIEVKVARTLSQSDARGLRKLRDAAGARFRRGVVLYGGNLVVKLDDRIEAWPIHSLWDHNVDWKS